MANLVTEHGAVADGKWYYGAWEIAVSSNHLYAPAAAPDFVIGDEGKSISVGNAGGDGPQGGSPLDTTILTYISPTEVLLATNASYTVGSGANVIVSWGTNNRNAFLNFCETYVGDTGVVLTIPAGVYHTQNSPGGLFEGPAGLTVNATGATVSGSDISLGSGAQYGASGHAARTQSVSAGATSVTLVTPSQHSRFSVGQYLLMTGMSTQYGGYPSNHAIFDYVLVSAIDSDSGSPTYGKISFATTPLTESYRSTWPVFDATGLDYGGPATLYDMNFSDVPEHLGTSFNHTLVINGLTVAHHAQFKIHGLRITLNDCVFAGDYGPYPTMAETVVLNDCTGLTCTMEYDKYVKNCTLTGCSWGGITLQSTNCNFTLDSTSIEFTLLCCAQRTIIRNECEIGTLIPGVGTTVGYGYAKSLQVSDSTIDVFGDSITHFGGMQITGPHNENDGLASTFDFTDGVIKFANSLYTTPLQTTQHWPYPGGRYLILDPAAGTLGLFTITNITQDATYTYLTTDWPGGWPGRTYGSSGVWLVSHPAQTCTFSGNTGCPEVVGLSNAPAGRPLYSHYKRVHDYTTDAGRYWPMYGKISYIKVTVTQLALVPCTVTLLMNSVNASTFADVSFSAVINCVAGLNVPRLLDARSAFTGTWTGGQTGDTLTNITTPLWHLSLFRVSMSAVSAANSPLVEVEFITEQGIGLRTFTCTFAPEPLVVVSRMAGGTMVISDVPREAYVDGTMVNL